MRINIEKVELLLAQKAMRKYELAQRMQKDPSYITFIFSRARDAAEFEPYVVGQLARALEVEVTEILGDGEAA